MQTLRHLDYFRESGSCEEFANGGCGGSANSFASLEMCEILCATQKGQTPDTEYVLAKDNEKLSWNCLDPSNKIHGSNEVETKRAESSDKRNKEDDPEYTLTTMFSANVSGKGRIILVRKTIEYFMMPEAIHDLVGNGNLTNSISNITCKEELHVLSVLLKVKADEDLEDAINSDYLNNPMIVSKTRSASVLMDYGMTKDPESNPEPDVLSQTNQPDPEPEPEGNIPGPIILTRSAPLVMDLSVMDLVTPDPEPESVSQNNKPEQTEDPDGIQPEPEPEGNQPQPVSQTSQPDSQIVPEGRITVLTSEIQIAQTETTEGPVATTVQLAQTTEATEGPVETTVQLAQTTETTSILVVKPGNLTLESHNQTSVNQTAVPPMPEPLPPPKVSNTSVVSPEEATFLITGGRYGQILGNYCPNN